MNANCGDYAEARLICPGISIAHSTDNQAAGP